MSFTCPTCHEHHYGSMRMEDGTYRRFCNGRLADGTRCQFSWPEADDTKYGLEPVNVAPSVGQVPSRRKQVHVTYFSESGKYYSDDRYWTDQKHFWDIADELHEMFAKGERPGLADNPSGGLGKYIAHAYVVAEDDGLPGVPFVVTQASQAEYMSKKPARQRLKLRTEI